MPPWIGSAAVRIGKATNTCFITIIKCRCSRQSHLNNYSLTQYCLIDILTSCFRCSIANSSYPAIRSGQKSGMIMIIQFIHGCFQRLTVELSGLIGNRINKHICISQQILSKLVTVFLHSRQEPGYRLHKGIIVHNCIPLISLQP